MKTKELVKRKAMELFNRNGVRNVTLREVAKALDKSYGNITYHFKTKNDLILELYEDMKEETQEILNAFDPQNLLSGILDAPRTTFAISMKYLFFYVDYVEIRRNFEAVYARVEADIELRKQGYLQVLQLLQTKELLREDLTHDDLDYLMDLSGAMRTFFFLNLSPKSFTDPALEDHYIRYMNKLLFPYLTHKGIQEYMAFSA